MDETKPLVYVETTIISYLTSRRNRDLIVAAHQEVTREWWERRRSAFRLVASQLVLAEAAAGDPAAARGRLELLESIELVEATPEALELARSLVANGAIPAAAPEDALHVAIAATNGADYLLTWNCKHIANATIRSRIEVECQRAGLLPPVLCTPLELLEEPNDVA
jgi:predicted nucleic acid-binding protein